MRLYEVVIIRANCTCAVQNFYDLELCGRHLQQNRPGFKVPVIVFRENLMHNFIEPLFVAGGAYSLRQGHY